MIELNETEPFTCPKCGAVSHHPKDKEQGYCGRCHAFTVADRVGDLVDEGMRQLRSGDIVGALLCLQEAHKTALQLPKKGDGQ
jgi:ribosomal protein S27AE